MSKSSGGTRNAKTSHTNSGSVNATAKGEVANVSDGGYEYERESEKAVMVHLDMHIEYAPKGGFTSSLVRERNIERDVWIPKSQIKDGEPSEWILNTKKNEIIENSIPYNAQALPYSTTARFTDKNGKEIKGKVVKTEYQKQKEERYKQGVERHDKLVQEAKELGIKGVRQTLKTATLEKMIKEAKEKK